MYGVALTVGVFDMLHEGHVNLLQKMHRCATNVHAIVHDDYSTFLNKGRFPVQSLDVRRANLKHFVERERVSFDPDPSKAIADEIARARWSGATVVYVRGDDWLDFPGKQVVIEAGVPLEFIPYTQGISSTERRDEL